MVLNVQLIDRLNLSRPLKRSFRKAFDFFVLSMVFSEEKG